MIVYKVVREVYEGDYRSAFVNFNNGYSEMEARYEVGRTTYPTIPNSFLYAFRTEEHARDWMRTMSIKKTTILKCQAKTSRKNPKTASLLDACRFWGGEDCEYGDVEDAPTGTIWCEWIKPIGAVD
jgi:hypothetical protein